MSARQRPCLALAVASTLGVSSCATVVFPPQHVADPAQVGVLDHGHHTSLIVQTADDDMLRYSYGDWKWYALRQTGPAEGSAALLRPTQAALGRKELPGPFSPTAVVREVRVPIEHAIYLTVDAREVRRLVGRLNRIFYDNQAEQIDNDAYDLVFVPHPQRYWMFHNSNQVVAQWLVELQCRVEGPALVAEWRLGAETAASAATNVSASSVARDFASAVPGPDGSAQGRPAGLPSAFSARSGTDRLETVSQGPGSTRAPNSPRPLGASGSTAPNQAALVAPGQPVPERSAAPEAAGPVGLGR
jgi:hypothetical protein